MFRKSTFSLGASTKNTQGLLHRPAGPQLPNILPTESGESVWSIDGSHFLRLLLLWMPWFMLTCSATDPPPQPQSRFLARMGHALCWNQWWILWYWDLKLTLVGQILGNIPLADNLNLFERIRSPQGGNCKLLYVPMGSQFPLQIYTPSPENPLFQPSREYWKEYDPSTLIDQKQNSSNQK